MPEALALRGRRLKRRGAALVLAGFIACLFAYLALFLDRYVVTICCALLILPLAVAGMILHFKGRRMVAACHVETPEVFYKTKENVLYLRSFRADTTTAWKAINSGLTSEEEQLAETLIPFGPFIAIGRPGEPLPSPGGIRVYAEGDQWKSVVLELMRSAKLVVIRAGSGAGLLWEVEQALVAVNRINILILIFGITSKGYQMFRRRIKEIQDITLPDAAYDNRLKAIIPLSVNPFKIRSGFIRFLSDGAPEFLSLPSLEFHVRVLSVEYKPIYKSLKKQFALALRPVFDQHEVPWEPPGRFTRAKGD